MLLDPQAEELLKKLADSGTQPVRDDDAGGELARTDCPPVQVRLSSRLTIE